MLRPSLGFLLLVSLLVLSSRVSIQLGGIKAFLDRHCMYGSHIAITREKFFKHGVVRGFVRLLDTLALLF